MSFSHRIEINPSSLPFHLWPVSSVGNAVVLEMSLQAQILKDSFCILYIQKCSLAPLDGTALLFALTHASIHAAVHAVVHAAVHAAVHAVVYTRGSTRDGTRGSTYTRQYTRR